MVENDGNLEGEVTNKINLNVTFKDPEDLPSKFLIPSNTTMADFYDQIRKVYPSRMNCHIKLKFSDSSNNEIELNEKNNTSELGLDVDFNHHKDYKSGEVIMNLEIFVEFVLKKTMVVKTFALKIVDKDKMDIEKAVKAYLINKIDFMNKPIIEYFGDYQEQTSIKDNYLVVVTDGTFIEKVVSNSDAIDVILFWGDKQNQTALNLKKQCNKLRDIRDKVGLLFSTSNLAVK